MPNQLMQVLTESEGYCCVYGFFMARKDEGAESYKTAAIAAYMGTSDRNIRWWKQQIRDGQCCCEKLMCCRKATGEVPKL